MALSVVTALALLTTAAGHAEDSESDRRLTWVTSLDAIWPGPASCGSHLSAGPADADVELRLGGLPASTAGEEVHLQWWSPRKSATLYDPLTSIVNCSVHTNVVSAYPRYDEAAFNGGNVRVSESGEAVIRIQAPSTYFVWQWVAVPHIHLRLCTGAANIQTALDALMLPGPDPWISSGHESNMTILSVGPYAGRNGPATAGSAVPQPLAIITGVGGIGQQTALPSTTTMPITTTMAAERRRVHVNVARDALDLDALEFSPVYGCLLEQKFFDHFASTCATDCPQDSTVAHGQCVREETADPPSEVSVSWTLGINCGNPCWHDKKIVTLHNVRLSIAGHLDIPFQEVEVSTGFALSTSRRLSDTRTAALTVTVASNRISAGDATTLLGTYAQDAAAMSTLLGLNVGQVTSGLPADQNNLQDTTNMGQDSDPYVPAYNAAIDDVPTGGAGNSNSVVGMLPTEAIIGIATGIVVLAVIFGSVLFWRRRRQRRAQEEAQQAAKVGDKVAETEADGTAPAKPACV